MFAIVGFRRTHRVERYLNFPYRILDIAYITSACLTKSIYRLLFEFLPADYRIGEHFAAGVFDGAACR
jgi:hypothetical protein